MKTALLRSSLVAGSLTGLACFIYFYVLYAFGQNPFGQYRFMYLPIYALGLFVAVRYFREQYNNGVLHGWQGILIGLIANFIAATLTTLLLWLVMAALQPAMLDFYKQELVVWLEKAKTEMIKQFGEATYSQTLEQVKQTTAANVAFDVWIKTWGIGFVIAMAVGVLLRRLPK